MTNIIKSKENRAPDCGAREVVQTSTIGTADSRREWLRISDVTRFYGIGRSSIYELIAEGKIKSASICKRGNIRGIRLVSAVSLEAFLNSIAEGGIQEQPAAAQ